MYFGPVHGRGRMAGCHAGGRCRFRLCNREAGNEVISFYHRGTFVTGSRSCQVITRYGHGGLALFVFRFGSYGV